jgi:hypothetical protein
VLCIVFEVTLAVLYCSPVIRPLNPSFGFVAASLTMSEKVEATVSKVGDSEMAGLDCVLWVHSLLGDQIAPMLAP